LKINNNNSDEDSIFMNSERNNIIYLLDSFIEQINKIRNFLIGVSVSSIILAPIAISLVLYLVTHPSFLKVLEAESEFGFGLVVLLSAVIIISSILFVTGIIQYRQIGSWHKKYESYRKEKDEVEQYISNKFKFDSIDTNNNNTNNNNKDR
jgi:predicted PurR-regulated permease PerM